MFELLIPGAASDWKTFYAQAKCALTYNDEQDNVLRLTKTLYLTSEAFILLEIVTLSIV